MSRRENDYYPTPPWCVLRLLDAVRVEGRILEPAAGDGAIIRALRLGGAKVTHVTAVDIDHRHVGALAACADEVITGDALGLSRMREPYDAIVTNPPYSLAFEFACWAVGRAHLVAMLLRLSFLGSVRRAAWLQAFTPSVLVLPNRPSFTSDGQTDSSDYAWFVWGLPGGPTVQVLGTTPKSERVPPPSVNPYVGY